MAAVLNVTFHGVRGVAPTPGTVTRRYGAETACVSIEVPKREPLVFDLGTGFDRWADTAKRGGIPMPTLRAHVLLSHMHAGHVAGAATLRGLEVDGARIDLYGPATGGGATANGVGDLRVIPVEDEELAVGDAKVMVRGVDHGGATNGYRVDWEGVSVAYVGDHQAPAALDTVPQDVLELADGVDLLVHDAQLLTDQWQSCAREGHSTVDYAVLVAREAGARCLALFHHDPAHDDDAIDRLLLGAGRTAERLGVDEVIAAAEGTTIAFDR